MGKVTKEMYRVQLGAYSTQSAAKKMVEKAKKYGYSAVIQKLDGLWKVQIGSYSDKKNAEKRAAEAIEAGLKPAVVPFKTVVEDHKISSVLVPAEDPEKPIYIPKFKLWFLDFMDEDESVYGDSEGIIEYGPDGKTIAHCVWIDGGQRKGTTVKKLKKFGVKTIDALVLSHAHGDHYGAWIDIFKNFKVLNVYLPDCKELDKHQKSYGDAIRNQAKKAKSAGAQVNYISRGDSFDVGHIHCDCIWHADAKALKEHDSHHFVNNMSIVTVFTIDNLWKLYTAGDLQNEPNKLIVKAGIESAMKADFFKCQWHGDRSAILTDLMKKIKPLVGVSNYHHRETRGSGRKGTRTVIEKVGGVVARNHENGDVFIDIYGQEAVLSCSKGNLKKTFKK